MRRAVAIVGAIMIVLAAIRPVSAQSFVPPQSPKTALSSSPGIWIDRSTIASLPTRGAAWNDLVKEASHGCGTPKLSYQDDNTNVCIMAKALVFARTRESRYGSDVRTARGTAARIESDVPVPVQVDGDAFGETPLEVSLRPGAARVLVPGE